MTELLFAGYVAVFAVAALACLAGLPRVAYVEDPGTRRGLVGLLSLSGAWAAAYVALLVVPWPNVKLAAYVAGLVCGFAAVGAWLYFCSAYTGRTLHRNPTVRRAAVVVFLAVTALKVTNPVHGLYFSAAMASTPFPHLAVEHHALHWVAMGISYVLAGVGCFVLFELFAQTGYDTRPLLALVALTGLPVAFDVAAPYVPRLLSLTYEPVGVAAFAVGVLFVYLDRFQAVRLAGDVDDAVVFVTDAGRVRDANERARELFPALADAAGQPLADAAPALADRLGTDGDDVLERTVGGEPRFYQVTATPFTFGRTRVGRMVVVADVTREERDRRQIRRQNERLGQFASVVSHDLRNPLNVAKGRLELEREAGDSENLDAVARALDRMEAIIEGVLTLAREGEDVGEPERVSLAALARTAWESVAAEDASLVVEDDLAVLADEDRVVQLLENLFRNAVEHGSASPDSRARRDAAERGGPGVAIRVGPLADADGFYVEDDGPGIPPDVREEVFETGFSTTETGTGLGLAIVETIASAHGWDVSVTEATASTTGARFEIAGVELAEERCVV